MHTYLGQSLSLWFLSLLTAQADKDNESVSCAIYAFDPISSEI